MGDKIVLLLDILIFSIDRIIIDIDFNLLN